MGSLSDYSENKLLDHALNVNAYTPVATVYLALSRADPEDNGAGIVEPSGDGYTRKTILFTAAAGRELVQSGDIEFEMSTSSWGTITHYAIFDAATGGNILAHGSIVPSKVIDSGKTPKILTGQVTISYLTGAISTYLANALLNLMFRNQAYSPPSMFVALVKITDPDDDSTGSSIDEITMTGYSRQASGAFSAAVGGASDNDSLIDFGTFTGTSQTVVASVMCDAATDGNALFYDPDLVNMVVADGDSVQYAAGDLNISMS